MNDIHVHVLGLMDQCDTKIVLMKHMYASDLYFTVQRFCFVSLRPFDGGMDQWDNKN